MTDGDTNQMVAVMREGWVLSQRLDPAPTVEAIKAMTAIHFKDLETEKTHQLMIHIGVNNSIKEKIVNER